MFERKRFENLYEGAVEPFKILENLYFVGCFPASSHLIDTGDGLLLIDTGYSETLFLLIDSIYKLGFKPTDIKYILHTHWHYDHTEATKALVSLCGAKTLIGEKDVENVRRYFEPNIYLKDGDSIYFRNVTIEIVETPGHTKGTISPFFNITDGGKTYRVGMFGGAGANTLKPGAQEYPECVSDYLASIERLRKEKVDVFIGNHVWNNDTCKKGELLKLGGENPFIDGEIFYEFLNFCEKRAKEVNGLL